MNPTRWRADLTFLFRRIEETHPRPYARISRRAFHQASAALRRAIPGLSDAQVVVRLMALVASLQDGHTTLVPLDPMGFNAWYPLRCYDFEDGLFITAAAPPLRELIGGQVLRIGARTATEAAALVSRLQGADNEYSARERIQYLTNAAVLHALKISPSPRVVTLQVRLPDGTLQKVELTAQETAFEDDRWMYWGEMYGPPGLEMLAAAPGGELAPLPSDEYRRGRADLPLHLRCRGPFVFTYLEEARSVYMQFNFVQNAADETFSDFHQRLFAWIDQHPVDKFILDLRYNSGGNGGLLIPFLHQLIKRDALNQPGHLYVLIGRKTFSAGVMLIGYLLAHTHAFFIGEPAGAGLNHYGDTVSYRLPNSGMQLRVSRLYHQFSSSDDLRRFVPVQFPAAFRASQYFAGEDPAREAALTAAPIPIPDLLWQQGRAAAQAAYQAQARVFGPLAGWEPFTESAMNEMGYRLLAAGRGEDALAAFEFNAARFPQSWNTWDSLAEAQLQLGRPARARENYRKSYALNPGNETARKMMGEI